MSRWTQLCFRSNITRLGFWYPVLKCRNLQSLEHEEIIWKRRAPKNKLKDDFLEQSYMMSSVAASFNCVTWQQLTLLFYDCNGRTSCDAIMVGCVPSHVGELLITDHCSPSFHFSFVFIWGIMAFGILRSSWSLLCLMNDHLSRAPVACRFASPRQLSFLPSPSWDCQNAAFACFFLVSVRCISTGRSFHRWWATLTLCLV